MVFADFTKLRIPEPAVLLLMCVAALIGLVVLAACRHRLAGTTLVAPCTWGMISIVLITMCELLVVFFHQSTGTSLPVDPLRFMAATSTFCPVIAIFGARRPHDRAWQFIVASLWAILSGPAILAILFRPALFQVDTIWSFFLLLLIGTGAANYIPTRFWPSALLLAIGQLLLLGHHLPGIRAAFDSSDGNGHVSQIGILLIAAAIVLLPLSAKIGQRRAKPSLDRLWIDYRNLFGALWSLRLADRINTSARRYNGTLMLRWNGFQHVPEATSGEAVREEEQLSSDERQALGQDMRNYLRRFVSPEWIEGRLTGSEDKR